MKWIKGFLIFGMVMLAHSTVSINTLEAKPNTEQADTQSTTKKGKSAKKGKATNADDSINDSTKKIKKTEGLFSSFTSSLKKAGSNIASSAKAAGSKAVKSAKAAGSKAVTSAKAAGSKAVTSAKAAGSKIASGVKAVKDKASNAVACLSANGEVPGQKLYAMAAAGTPLTDAHVVAAHKTAPKRSGR